MTPNSSTDSATRDGVRQLLLDAAIAYDDARVRRSKARALQRKLLRDYLGNEGSYYDAAEDRQPEIDAALAEGTASSKAKISAHAKLIRAIKAARALSTKKD
jgi:hypothetical protein